MHDSEPAGISVLVAQTLEDPLRSMTLLRRTAFVVFQDLVDDADEWIQLRPLRRSAAAITRWNREQQHLGKPPGINAKSPRHLPIAQPFPLHSKAPPSI